MVEVDCLFNNDEVEVVIGCVVEVINCDFGEINLVVFCVMNGGLIFFGKLFLLFDFFFELFYLYVICYCNEIFGGELFWKVKLEIFFIDCDVLIIDDIFDEGYIFLVIIDFCKYVGVCVVYIVVLVDKEYECKVWFDFKVSFIGFYCVDCYVFGYGMDYKGYWCNVVGIFVVKGF